MPAIYRTDLPCLAVKDGDEYGYIIVGNATDAARVFAGRYAKRTYGKRGYCHHVRQDSYTQDQRTFHYEAFIGTATKDGGTNGHNVWLTVTVEQARSATPQAR